MSHYKVLYLRLTWARPYLVGSREFVVVVVVVGVVVRHSRSSTSPHFSVTLMRYQLGSFPLNLVSDPNSLHTPLAGVTWAEHATYLLLHSDLGEEALCLSCLTQHSGFLEVRVPGTRNPPFVDTAESVPSPRLIRTHLPYSFLKEQLTAAQPKVLVVLRNVKDCLVSYYHYLRKNEDIYGFTGEFSDFFELVREKRLTFGDWFDYTLGWWTQQDSEDVLFLEYEDMVQDIRKEVQNIVDFLELDRTDSVIESVAERSTFQQMFSNPMTQLRIFPFLENESDRFMRKGIVGDWQEHFNDEQNAHIDAIYEQRIKGTGLLFEFGKRKN